MGFANLSEELISKGKTCLLGDTAIISLNYMIWLLPEFFRFFMPKAQQERRKVTISWQKWNGQMIHLIFGHLSIFLPLI